MGEFVRATLSFPTVLFTLGLAGVLIYWVLVLIGRVEPDMNGPRRDSVAADRFSDIPRAVVFTSLSAQGWFWALLGTTMAGWDSYGAVQAFCTGLFIVVIALCLAYVGTAAVAYLFRRIRDARH
ncbi:hypothetical protein [Nocardia spumae]|uniref:hypothetical protein n=1 Tax=Nocardia spumae TaxID=2887190 RepID=UPI001D13EF9E|nr:hypothetical protein [Nocardia spumae]